MAAWSILHLPWTTSTILKTIRFSRPITTSRLRNPISISTIATLFPSSARAAPMEEVAVVFPTPPFPDVTTIILPSKLHLNSYGLNHFRPGHAFKRIFFHIIFNHNNTLLHTGKFRTLGSWFAGAGGCYQSDLYQTWVKYQGKYHGPIIFGVSGMDFSCQGTKHNDITACG